MDSGLPSLSSENTMTNRHFIITLLLFAVNQFSGTNALAAAILKTVNRSDESARLQLSLHFDQIPGFHISTNGRRVDLEFSDTNPAEPLASPAIDDKMIKMVKMVGKTAMTLSFYFRYPPQKVSTESSKETGMLILDILLGNQLSVFPSGAILQAPRAQGGQTRLNPILLTLSTFRLLPKTGVYFSPNTKPRWRFSLLPNCICRPSPWLPPCHHRQSPNNGCPRRY